MNVSKNETWYIEKGLSFNEAIKTRQFYTMAIVYNLFYTCSNTIMIHIVPHGIDLGLSAANAAKVLSTLGALSIAGRFLMGVAGGRIGNIKAIFICFIFLFTGLIATLTLKPVNMKRSPNYGL